MYHYISSIRANGRVGLESYWFQLFLLCSCSLLTYVVQLVTCKNLYMSNQRHYKKITFLFFLKLRTLTLKHVPSFFEEAKPYLCITVDSMWISKFVLWYDSCRLLSCFLKALLPVLLQQWILNIDLCIIYNAFKYVFKTRVLSTQLKTQHNIILKLVRLRLIHFFHLLQHSQLDLDIKDMTDSKHNAQWYTMYNI